MTDGGSFRDELMTAGLLVPTGTDGIYGRSSVYEDIVAAVDSLAVAAAASEGAVSYRFPPVMPRDVFERTGYLSSFPDLMGSVSTFTGNNADHRKLMDVAQSGGDWTALLEAAGVNLCPAACHPLYPTLAGTLPEGGSRYDVAGWCYRHEPSVDPARMQAFRMHELVYVGDAARASEHRDRWLQLGVEILGSLGLEVETVVANDPFFGRVGRILADNQRAETLKYEIVTQIDSVDRPTAIGSSNCHLDHFGQPFGIVTADGEVAHSCCFGFGLDRIALALLRTHGMHPGDWPVAARDRLWG
ncbi:MAG: amino acid--[acyl-carrier-protein] ligase [Acidimicrobiales bacterium]|jgi:seryl-tRNA synthetase